MLQTTFLNNLFYFYIEFLIFLIGFDYYCHFIQFLKSSDDSMAFFVNVSKFLKKVAGN